MANGKGKRNGLRALLVCALAMLTVACGGGDNSPPPPPAPAEGSATLGANGGTVEGPDGTRLVVGPDGLAAPVTLRIARDGTGAPALDGLNLVSPVYAVTPHGTTFASPAVFSIPRAAATLVAGDTPILLKAEPGGKWRVLADTGRVAGALSADVGELSFFVLALCSRTGETQGWIIGAVDCPSANSLQLFLDSSNGGPVNVVPSGNPVLSPIVNLSGPTTLNMRLRWTRAPGTTRTDQIAVTGTPGGFSANNGFASSWTAVEDVNTDRDRFFTVTIDPARVAGASSPGGRELRINAYASYGTTAFQVGRGNVGVGFEFVTHLRIIVRYTGTQPVITQQPANIGVVEGQPASFSVAASITPAETLAYQWSRRADASAAFAPIAGATAATLNLPATALTDNGAQFQVVVCAASTRCVTSSPVTLTVTRAPTAPSFTLQPVSIAVVAGQTASFTVTATGNPLPRIDWQSASASDPNNFTALSVAPNCVRTDPPSSGTSTTATCTVGPLAVGDSGRRYRAAGTNSVTTTTSTVATVTVSAAPVAPIITLPPESKITTVGGSATFSVTATGSAPLNYTWQLGGNNLPPMSGGFNANAGSCIGNVTYSDGNATITLSNITVGCNGVAISVTVSNGILPNALSSNVPLTVNPVTQSLSLLAGAIGGGGTLDGTGTSARVGFSPDWGIAFDNTGTAYFSDRVSNRIRKVTPAGVVTTLDPTLRGPAGVAVDAAGNIYVAEYNADRITRITPAGVASVFAGGIQGDQDGTGTAARFAQPQGLAIDAAGNLYVAETPSQRNGKIRKISPAGVVTTFYDFGAPYGRAALAVDAAGTVYAAGGTAVQRIPPNTPAGTAPVLAGDPTQPGNLDGQGTAARFNFISGIALAADGNLYVTASNNFNVRRITLAGEVITVSGGVLGGAPGDGFGTSAGYEFPSSIAAAPGGGYLLIGDVTTMRKLTLSNAFASTFLGSRAQRGINDGSGAAARFNSGGDVVLDAAGNAYVAGGDRIRKIQPDGLVTTVAVTPANYLAIDPTSGVLVAANQLEVWRVTAAGLVSRLAGDSQVQDYVDGQGANAAFYQIAGLAVDRAGNVFVAEGLSHTIRRISSAGAVTTIAGARDQSGTNDGTSLARFNSPAGMAVDANDNLFVGDSGNLTIRKITPAGVVSTPAGTPGVSGSTDGNGPAASFRGTGALAFDRNGRLLIADGCTVRRMEPSTFAISTVLGVDGQCGVVLGNGPRINGASGVAVRSDGRLVLMSDFAVLEATVP